MNGATHATEGEPIVLGFSDGRRYTLKPKITRHIWQELERGHYSGPEEFINRASDALFSGDIQSVRSKAEADEG
jgi:hypothetical protein